MFVNRGIYHEGWTACTRHSTPWVDAALPELDDDVWELYPPDDWTQARNVASEHPDKLAELQRLFLIEAIKHNVLPLDDRRFERFNADLAGRPQWSRERHRRCSVGMVRLSENSVVVMKNKSHAVTADIDVPAARRQRRDRLPRRSLRRMVALRRRRQAGLLLQPVRPAAIQGRRRSSRPAGQPSGAHGVHLRRRGARKGWRRHALRRRPADGQGSSRCDGTDAVLR